MKQLFVGFTYRNFSPCDLKVEKEITCKMMGDNNKHAIRAPLLSLLLLVQKKNGSSLPPVGQIEINSFYAMGTEQPVTFFYSY